MRKATKMLMVPFRKLETTSMTSKETIEADIARVAAKLLRPEFTPEMQQATDAYAVARQAQSSAQAELRAKIHERQKPNSRVSDEDLSKMERDIELLKSKRFAAKAKYDAALAKFRGEYLAKVAPGIVDSVHLIHEIIDLLEEACEPLVRLSVDCGQRGIEADRTMQTAFHLQASIREFRRNLGSRD